MEPAPTLDAVERAEMTIGLLAASLSIASGAFVGLTLGLIGGGGSVLAVPLLVYLVGVPSPHLSARRPLP